MDKQAAAIKAAIEALEVSKLELWGASNRAEDEWLCEKLTAAHTVCAAALRLLREAGDGWELIETAPKDGSEVDVWTSEGREPDAVYKDGCWRVRGIGGFDQMGYVRMAYQPTHWRPLPAPPEGK